MQDALYRDNGEIIAVVEAKKAGYDPVLAQAQARFYVSEIAKHQNFTLFAFTANGNDTYFLDSSDAAPRLVAGFFSPTDLESLLYLRQNEKALASQPINNSITNRPYQHEAIRRACEALDAGRRKTRTAMSLVDLFLRADQAGRILFVADRDELVKQALNDGFKVRLPNEPAIRIVGGNVAKAKTNRLLLPRCKPLARPMSSSRPAFSI